MSTKSVKPMGKILNTARYLSFSRLFVSIMTLAHYCGKACGLLFHRKHTTLDQRSGDIVGTLKSRGFVILDHYYSPAECNLIKDEIDRVVDQYPEAISLSDDNSDIRIFDAEKISPAIRRFHEDPFLLGILRGHARTDVINTSTLAARLSSVVGNEGSGGGWHRDSFGSPIKAILYVSNVTDDTGPFQFLPSSNKLKNIVRDLWITRLPFLKYRFTEEDISQIRRLGNYEIKTLIGDAGTVVLIDTAAIHRGKPISLNSRYALTNYYSLAYKDKKRRAALVHRKLPQSTNQ